MVRTEIQLFLENVPGELGKLASLLGNEGVNIDAMTIPVSYTHLTLPTNREV